MGTIASLRGVIRKRRVSRVMAAVLALGVVCGTYVVTAGSPNTIRNGSARLASEAISAKSLAAAELAYQEAYAVPAPAIRHVPALPGPVVQTPRISPSLTNLTVSPEAGVAGSPMTISGSGLAPNTKIDLTWSTANDTWAAQVEPDTANYLGRVTTELTVSLARTTTDAKGAFGVTVKAPHDWGGVHDIYAVVKGTAVAHGGFLLARWAKVTPLRGPVGTPITITYGGLGDLLYEGGFSVLWDNHYVGEGMSTWTRGTASVTIRATGPVGRHTIQIGNAITYLYLNVPQSPMPFTTGYTFRFTTTADNGPPPASINWPDKVAPTVSEKTTLDWNGLGSKTATKMRLSTTSGAVMSKVGVSVSKLSSNAPVTLVWSTVVGNRVNCKSVCWSFVSVPLGTVRPTGRSFHTTVTVPDGLGGWHAIQAIQGGKIKAELPFYIHISIVGRGVSSRVVKEGQEFTIHLKGVGWTQLDNTVAVDYDNSYVGYGCGFNSNGDVVLHLVATGGPGTHLIDIYPMLYTLSPSFWDAEYGMVPVLTYAQDEPSLALGYQPAALRLAITVVR